MTVDVIAVEPVVRTRKHIPEAECSTCGLYVEMVPGADAHASFQRLRAAHPLTAGLPHARQVPHGWRVPLSSPGALSQ
jgi:hypothetical protein